MTERIGLYILVILAMLAGFESCENSEKILRKLDTKLELKTKDVLGGDLPEKFYEVNGKRAYVEIDGIPVEKYFSSRYQDQKR